jgi:hypothetical protein
MWNEIIWNNKKNVGTREYFMVFFIRYNQANSLQDDPVFKNVNNKKSTNINIIPEQMLMVPFYPAISFNLLN